ncbi:hypothetical protein ADL26_20765, partial [Thermoactinomyces vulgaris]
FSAHPRPRTERRLHRGTRPIIAAAIALPLLVGSAPVSGADADPAQVWLVELAPGANAAALEATSLGLDYTVRHDFSRVWNGVSVEADPATARRLERLELVEE